MIRKYSEKALEKRKEERKDFPEFFKRHVKIARRKCCEECGLKLAGNVSEIAHILPKSYFKSISTLDENILYLCGFDSKNQCHSNFDNWSNEEVKNMTIYPKAQEIFAQLKDKITEKLNYKHSDKYE